MAILSLHMSKVLFHRIHRAWANKKFTLNRFSHGCKCFKLHVSESTDKNNNYTGQMICIIKAIDPIKMFEFELCNCIHNNGMAAVYGSHIDQQSHSNHAVKFEGWFSGLYCAFMPLVKYWCPFFIKCVRSIFFLTLPDVMISNKTQKYFVLWGIFPLPLILNDGCTKCDYFTEPSTNVSMYIIVLLALICFYPTLNGDFVFDDSEAVVNNADVKLSTPLYKVFLNDFWGTRITHNASHKSYRPLAVLSYRSVISVLYRLTVIEAH